MAQNKKLKTDERLKTLNLLASLAPSAETSAALASTAGLYQNPSAPTSANDRQGWKEDRIVRKGIEKLKDRNGDFSGSDSESEGDMVEEVETTGRRKGRPMEVITEIDREDQIKQTAEPTKPVQATETAGKPKKAKSKSKSKGKKVGFE